MGESKREIGFDMEKKRNFSISDGKQDDKSPTH